MLRTLSIRNLALVEDVRIDCQPGLNIITGETGAGKSILIGALGLLLGERADKTMIRQGETTGSVEAEFLLSRPAEMDALLETCGLAGCEEGLLVIRRSVSDSGAGRQTVNDAPVTLQTLRQMGELLVDMHGPHDHQSLLNTEFQLRVVDDCGHLAGERGEYGEQYGTIRELLERRKALEGDGQEVLREIDLLQFQAREISEAGLQEGEEERIESEHRLLGNAHRILELTARVREALTESESSALNHMAVVRQALDELRTLADQANAWKDEVHSLAVQIQELSRSVAHLAQTAEGDPRRLDWLDERLAVYRKMKRKYGATVTDILNHERSTRDRLRDLQTREERLAAIDRELAEARKRLEDLGQRLRTRRQAVAGRLTKAIVGELQDLGFVQAAFHIDFKAVAPSRSGMDEIEFGFSANRGEALRPLKFIASSGEISRVMLAVKAVLAEQDRIPVLVFDEIDVNIGGKTAHAVGLKLVQLARRHQVICITHLPQVAVQGDAQFEVCKKIVDRRTLTQIHLLDENARVEEIARMLGGRDYTSVTLDHAREMLGKKAR